MDVVEQINEAYTDDKGRPYRNIRIKHAVVLEDPFEDPPGLLVPPRYDGCSFACMHCVAACVSAFEPV
jgi:hypothetical protein